MSADKYPSIFSRQMKAIVSTYLFADFVALLVMLPFSLLLSCPPKIRKPCQTYLGEMFLTGHQT